MINAMSNFDSVVAYKDFERLPKGGYVLRIVDVNPYEKNDNQFIVLSCDIAEGEYKGFFSKRFEDMTGDNKKWPCQRYIMLPKDDDPNAWQARRLKTLVNDLEGSNPGYHFDWDETKFKGKLIGGLFNEEEYLGRDGDVRTSTRLASFCTVEKIRTGDFRLPKDKPLKKEDGGYGQPAASLDEFMNIPEDDELPFI